MTPKVLHTPTILEGKARLAGTRISVGTIVSYFVHGYGFAEIGRDYPHLTRAQIEVARRYVVNHPEEFQLAKTA